ncbi:MAG: acyl carrier protein [Tannerella sp.]|jgi:acyl carrier protein|nr:acyl carrier protein [Tannerella sp.]
MEKQVLITKINDVLANEFEIEVSTILPDANIKNTLQLDSLSLVDMVALIESAFNVKIKGTEIIQIQTFGNLYDFIHERKTAE